MDELAMALTGGDNLFWFLNCPRCGERTLIRTAVIVNSSCSFCGSSTNSDDRTPTIITIIVTSQHDHQTVIAIIIATNPVDFYVEPTTSDIKYISTPTTKTTVLSSKSPIVVPHGMQTFFSNRVINIWNSLPSHIVRINMNE